MVEQRLTFPHSFFLFLSFLFFSLLPSRHVAAQDWIIDVCSGGPPASTTSNLYGPMYSVATANATSRTATIYPATQLSGISGSILTSAYFHKGTTTGAMAGTPNFKIYLKEVTIADWGTGVFTWATEIAGATLVYDGNPITNVGTAIGWKGFDFTANFTYSGTQNLAVFFEYNNPVASVAIPWSYEYTAPCAVNTNGTKYLNNTTGTLPPTLTSSNLRRPYIAFDTLPGVDNNIGADSLLYPTGNFCSGPTAFGVRVTNFGTNDAANFELHWSVNGVLQTPLISNTLINSLYTSPNYLDINLGSVNFPYGQNTEVKIWTHLPNGVADADNTNDTLVAIINPPTEGVSVHIDPQDTIACDGITMTLNAGAQPTGAIYVWNTGALTQSITVGETGSYSVKVQSAGGCTDMDTVQVTFAPPPAAQAILVASNTNTSYTFNLFAEQNVQGYTWNYGDGSNEENGPGPKIHEYPGPGVYTVTCTLSNSCGTNIVSRPLQIVATSINDIATLNNNVALFPNPAKDKMKVTTQGGIRINSVTLHNLLGQQLMIQKASGSECELNLENYATGNYQVTIDTDKGRLVKKLQILE